MVFIQMNIRKIDVALASLNRFQKARLKKLFACIEHAKTAKSRGRIINLIPLLLTGGENVAISINGSSIGFDQKDRARIGTDKEFALCAQKTLSYMNKHSLGEVGASLTKSLAYIGGFLNGEN